MNVCRDCRRRYRSGTGTLCQKCAGKRIRAKVMAFDALAAAYRRDAPEAEVDRLRAAAWGRRDGQERGTRC